MNVALPSSRPVPLSQLAPGQSAEVKTLDGSSPIGRRLLELGFRPGTRLRVIRCAPLGDPTTYELRGSRFCLRRSEAERIGVTLLSEDASGPPRAARQAVRRAARRSRAEIGRECRAKFEPE